MNIQLSKWLSARVLCNRSINRAFSDVETLSLIKRDIAGLRSLKTPFENFDILSLQSGTNSVFFNSDVGHIAESKLEAFSKVLNQADCILLFNEVDSFFPGFAAENAKKIREWLNLYYSIKYLDCFASIKCDLINHINFADSHLDQSVGILYLEKMFRSFELPFDVQLVVPCSYRPRPSDLIVEKYKPLIPDAPRVFEKGRLLYTNENSTSKNTGLVRVFSNPNSVFQEGLAILGTSDTYSTLVPLLTQFFNPVLHSWGMDFSVFSKLPCVALDSIKYRVVSLRERFLV